MLALKIAVGLVALVIIFKMMDYFMYEITGDEKFKGDE